MLADFLNSVIGQFVHQKAQLSSEPLAATKSLVLRSSHTKERTVDVRLGQRRNMDLNTHVPCWFVRNNGHGLIDGAHKEYIVGKLMHELPASVVARAQRLRRAQHKIQQRSDVRRRMNHT